MQHSHHQLDRVCTLTALLSCCFLIPFLTAKQRLIRKPFLLAQSTLRRTETTSKPPFAVATAPPAAQQRLCCASANCASRWPHTSASNCPGCCFKSKNNLANTAPVGFVASVTLGPSSKSTNRRKAAKGSVVFRIHPKLGDARPHQQVQPSTASATAGRETGRLWSKHRTHDIYCSSNISADPRSNTARPQTPTCPGSRTAAERVTTRSLAE